KCECDCPGRFSDDNVQVPRRKIFNRRYPDWYICFSGLAEKRLFIVLFTRSHTNDIIHHLTYTGRLGIESDLAGTALYLSSIAGAFVTGAVIAVDGGLSLKSRPSESKVTSKI